jgi:hypothetical protein
LTARSNCTHEHAIADVVTGNTFTEFFNHADRFMTDDETGRDRILAPDDVQICSTNRGQRHANDGLTGPSAWFLYLFDPDSVLTSKNICFHFNTSLLLQRNHA